MQLRLVSVNINTTPMFIPGGSIRGWASRVGAETTVNAKRESPHPGNDGKGRWGNWSTGALHASISTDVHLFGTRTILVDTGSAAPYALFVHEGTTGPITANTSKALRFGQSGSVIIRRPTHNGTVVTASVRGQRANPFLVRGYNDTARIHPALPRMPHEAITD